MRTLPSGLLALLLAAACARTADPLDAFRDTCRGLQANKQLKEGLTIDVCAKDLQDAANAADPARRAEELAGRIEALVKQGKGAADASQRLELRDAILSAQSLGKPAVEPLMKRLTGSTDANLRIAMAKALINICAEDCAKEKYDCIVPALLEGTTEGKPSEVRLEAIRGLTRCTGKGFGDEPKAWRDWWEGIKKTK